MLLDQINSQGVNCYHLLAVLWLVESGLSLLAPVDITARFNKKRDRPQGKGVCMHFLNKTSPKGRCCRSKEKIKVLLNRFKLATGTSRDTIFNIAFKRAIECSIVGES